MDDLMAIYGYARVSTDGQSLVAQTAELKAAKCAKVFQEKISGARSDRNQLMRLITVLGKGDVLVVTRLDRLASSRSLRIGDQNLRFYRSRQLNRTVRYACLMISYGTAERPEDEGDGKMKKLTPISRTELDSTGLTYLFSSG